MRGGAGKMNIVCIKEKSNWYCLNQRYQSNFENDGYSKKIFISTFAEKFNLFSAYS